MQAAPLPCCCCTRSTIACVAELGVGIYDMLLGFLATGATDQNDFFFVRDGTGRGLRTLRPSGRASGRRMGGGWREGRGSGLGFRVW